VRGEKRSLAPARRLSYCTCIGAFDMPRAAAGSSAEPLLGSPAPQRTSQAAQPRQPQGQRRPQHVAPAVLDQSVEAAAVRPAASDVSVQDISGTKHVLRVIDTWATTVSELKRELQQRSGIPPDAQRLLLNQQTLEDETKCLQAYGVQPGCTISLTLQDEAACAARREARLEKRVQDEAQKRSQALAEKLEQEEAQEQRRRSAAAPPAAGSRNQPAPAPQRMDADGPHRPTDPETGLGGSEAPPAAAAAAAAAAGDGWQKSISRSPHLCSCLLTVCLLIPLISMVIQAVHITISRSSHGGGRAGVGGFWDNLSRATSGGSGCNTTDCMPLLVPVVIVWLMYWFEICRSNSLQYLTNIQSEAAVKTYIARLKAARPVVQWSIQCYHEVEKEDDLGNRTTERTNTHSATHTWRYARCMDVTGPPPQFDRLTKITFKKVLSFDSPGSRGNYHRAMSAWVEANNRDAKYDFAETMYHLPGFEAKMVADVSSTTGHAKPACASLCGFCLASCGLCTTLWRWWFGSVSTTRTVCIHKRFSA
jgi:hypothetical protein